LLVLILIVSSSSSVQKATQSSHTYAAGVPDTPQTPTDPDVMIQDFYIGGPSSCYGSNTNCFVNDNGSRIQNVTVTADLGSPLSVTSSQDNGNFSLQVNAYSPGGYVPAYMQWVIGCAAQFTPGLMGCYLQAYYIQENDGVLLDQDGTPEDIVVPSSDLTTGTNISISANTNSTGSVVSASGEIRLANGTVVFSSLVSLTTFQYGNPNPVVGDAQVPIVGFEAELIGDGNADYATFTEASGSLIVKASGPIWSSPSPVGLPYVQYNLPNKGTVEKSNIAYGAYSHPTSSATSSSVTISTSSTSQITSLSTGSITQSTSSQSVQTLPTNTSQTTSVASTASSTLTSVTNSSGVVSTTGSYSGNQGGGIEHYIVVNRYVWLPFLIVAIAGLLMEVYTVWSRRRNIGRG
jgi:hypothetical protein